METAAPPRHDIPRDDYCSSGAHAGSLINLGHFKKRFPGHTEVYRNTFVVEDTAIDPGRHGREFAQENRGGLSHTRFGKGFCRRQENTIENPTRDEIAVNKQHAMERNEAARVSRTNLLKTIDNYNGYDIITGTERSGPRYAAKQRTEGIRYVGDGLGPEAPRRAHIILRDSSHRFFIPQYSGFGQESRMNTLTRDGLLAPKQCSVIQIGKNEMPSFGVEDQFSKSSYCANSDRASTGLVEARIAGRYTPRKQPGSPSGNPAVTTRWGKGVELSSF